MKRLLLLLLAFTAFVTVNGQNSNYKKLPSFGFQFSLIDFPTANDLRTSSLARVIDRGDWKKVGRMSPALTLNYMQGLSNYVDFMGRFTTGFVNYPFRNPSAPIIPEGIYLEADANANIKLLTDNYIVVPYVQVGVGGAYAKRKFMAQIPLGVGLQFKLGEETFLQVNTNYRLPVTDRANYSLFHSFGITAPLKQRKVVEPKVEVVVPEPPKDRDGDGVLDSLDACPDVPGLAAMKGCPDTDKDGITDSEDKCPKEAGLAKYQGCPIPDTDKDGINDENDKCPTVAGVARYDGCPVPDGDGDGVNDEEDKCPAVAGTVENFGCPQIAFEPSKVLFKSGSAVLLPVGKAELDKVATFLKDNTGFSVNVNGHTDNTGSDKVNDPLSVKRAEVAKAYLISKGVDGARLFAEGFGSSQPVDSNDTPQGRAQNRRVDVKIKQ